MVHLINHLDQQTFFLTFFSVIVGIKRVKILHRDWPHKTNYSAGHQRLVWSLHHLTPIQILNPSHLFHLKFFFKAACFANSSPKFTTNNFPNGFLATHFKFAAAAMPHKTHFIPQSQSERISGKPELSNHFSSSVTDIELWLKSSGNQNALTFFPLIRAGGLGVLCWACRAESRQTLWLQLRNIFSLMNQPWRLMMTDRQGPWGPRWRF